MASLLKVPNLHLTTFYSVVVPGRRRTTLHILVLWTHVEAGRATAWLASHTMGFLQEILDIVDWGLDTLGSVPASTVCLNHMNIT